MAEAAPGLSGLDAGTAERVRGVLDVPLHRFLGFEALAVAEGAARTRITVGEAHRANVPGLHGGVLYALMDASCYLALLPALPADRTAATVDIAVSMIRAVGLGATVEIAARADRIGRGTAFLAAEAHVAGALVAKAQVTKRVIPAPADG